MPPCGTVPVSVLVLVDTGVVDGLLCDTPKTPLDLLLPEELSLDECFLWDLGLGAGAGVVTVTVSGAGAGVVVVTVSGGGAGVVTVTVSGSPASATPVAPIAPNVSASVRAVPVARSRLRILAPFTSLWLCATGGPPDAGHEPARRFRPNRRPASRLGTSRAASASA